MLGDVEKTKDYLVSEEYNFRQIDDFSSVIDMDKYSKYYDIKVTTNVYNSYLRTSSYKDENR